MTTQKGTRREVVRASFDSPDAAEEAMLGLESIGIDAHDVHLATSPSVPTQEGERAADLRVTAHFGKRYAGGAVIGAVAGAVLVFVVLLAVGMEAGLAAGIGLLAGGTGGFFLGGYWGVASRLPVNAEAIDALAQGPDDDSPVAVEVNVIDSRARDRAAAVLREAGARDVAIGPSAF